MFERATAYDNLIRLAADGDLPAVPCGPSALYADAAARIKMPYTGFSPLFSGSVIPGSELLVAHSATTDTDYPLLGNPWFLEPEFPTQQMAVNPDDMLVYLQAILIRNAITDMEFIRVDAAGAEIGSVPLRPLASGYVNAAFMLLPGAWYATPFLLPPIEVSPQDLGLDAGDRFALRVAAMPEYYWRDAIETWGTDGAAPPEDWDMRMTAQLGAGALREYPLWVDSGEAPAMSTVNRSGSRFTVTVQDDLYTAWVTVLDTDFAPLPDVAGSGCVPNLDPDAANRPTGPGQSYDAEFTFPNGGVPEQFVIMVGDYAGNARCYQIDTDDAPVPVTPPPTPTPAPASTPTPTSTPAIVPLPIAPEEPDPTPTAVPTPAPAAPAPVPTAKPTGGSRTGGSGNTAGGAGTATPTLSPTPTPAPTDTPVSTAEPEPVPPPQATVAPAAAPEPQETEKSGIPPLAAGGIAVAGATAAGGLAWVFLPRRRHYK